MQSAGARFAPWPRGPNSGKARHMNSRNLLRLTDDIEDPVTDLRVALSQIVQAAGRALEEALEESPLRGVTRRLLRPQVKIADNDNEIVVTANLPGIDLESVAIT